MIYFRLETGMRLDFIPVSKFRTNKLYNYNVGILSI